MGEVSTSSAEITLNFISVVMTINTKSLKNGDILNKLDSVVSRMMVFNFNSYVNTQERVWLWIKILND